METKEKPIKRNKMLNYNKLVKIISFVYTNDFCVTSIRVNIKDVNKPKEEIEQLRHIFKSETNLIGFIWDIPIFESCNVNEGDFKIIVKKDFTII